MTSLNANLPIFVSEYGTTHADGGNPNGTNNQGAPEDHYATHHEANTEAWHRFMDTNMISSVAWNVNRKREGSAFFGVTGSFDQSNDANWTNTSLMTASGAYIYNKLRTYATSSHWVSGKAGAFAPIVPPSSSSSVPVLSSSSNNPNLSSSSVRPPVSSSSAKVYSETPCIAFANGVGGYNEQCYKSGLQNMESGACYVYGWDVNGSTVETDDASDSYYWRKVDCLSPGIDIALPPSSSSTSTPSSSAATVSGACVEFVNGLGGYQGKCFSSGLSNMAAQTCYALNSASDATWVSGDAQDSYWWKTVDCGTSSLRGLAMRPSVWDIQKGLLRIALPQGGMVKVQVLNLLGQEELLLTHGVLAAGSHEFRLQGLKAGLHLVRIQHAGASITRTIAVRP